MSPPACFDEAPNEPNLNGDVVSRIAQRLYERRIRNWLRRAPEQRRARIVQKLRFAADRSHKGDVLAVRYLLLALQVTLPHLTPQRLAMIGQVMAAAAEKGEIPL